MSRRPPKRAPKRSEGEPPSVSDEYRTPEPIGLAMACSAGVSAFGLDPFAPFSGYSGIPAIQQIHWKQDIYKTTPEPFKSMGFNVPFSEPGKALARIYQLVKDTDEVPIVGIVRADPSVGWWRKEIVNACLYAWAVFTPRINFWDAQGMLTTGPPSGGVAIFGTVQCDPDPVVDAVEKYYGHAWPVRI